MQDKWLLGIGRVILGALLMWGSAAQAATPPAAPSNPVSASAGAQGVILLKQMGCNSSANAPIPGTKNLFIARQLVKQNGTVFTAQEGCAADPASQEAIKSNRWGLMLSKLDWNKKQFSLVKPLLVPPYTVNAGPMKGAIIRTAYDASIVKYHGQYLISFVCVISNGPAYGVDGVSSCLVPFDLAREEIARDNIYVVVSGKYNMKKVYFSASVPQLLVAGDRLYIYWDVITVAPPGGQWVRSGVRGAELVADSSGNYWVKGVGGMAYSIDQQHTVEVWGPDTNNPMSTMAVDIRGLWTHGSDIIAMAGLGGGGCIKPNSASPGCFRLAIAKASQPLGDHIFNNTLVDEATLPTNPQEYTQPVIGPDGKYLLLGLFHYPYSNGYSELRMMPPPPAWPANVQPRRGLEVAFPFADSSLWPAGTP